MEEQDIPPKLQVQEHTIKEFTKMCERLESAFSDLPSSKRVNKGFPNPKGTRNVDATTATKKKFYCLLHSKNSTHNTKDCQTLNQQAEEIKITKSLFYSGPLVFKCVPFA